MQKINTCIPDWLIIGPQKAGTTWIYKYLLYRGDVCLPNGVKETFFFDKSYNRGLKWYQKHFTPTDHHIYTAEVGPTYFQNIQAGERIKETIGIIPLFCTLRNPADRSFSHYLHMRRYGMTRLDFRNAVEKHPEILESSRYATHLNRWYSIFGKENIHTLFHENLSKAPDQYAGQICRKTGLMEKPVPDELKKKINPATLPANHLLAFTGQRIADFVRYIGGYQLIEWAKKKGLKEIFFGKPGAVPVETLSPEDRYWLIKLLSSEIEQLENMTGIDLLHWKS
ncbi:MAG: sulfotransferase domain-containing protein [Desulfobacterales bacterium]|nr:sulfotransferase domain-containing protein [Desulfobacterales bacterium]